MGKFTLKGLTGNTAELGVQRGSERYDSASAELAQVAVVDLDELEEAIKAARAEGKASDKHAKDHPFTPHIDASHPSADSSFRSEDRPPILISSETNPSPENPVPVGPEDGGPSDIDRLPSGLADVPGNTQFDAAPGPNIAEPPEGVTQPKPSKDPAAGPEPTGQVPTPAREEAKIKAASQPKPKAAAKPATTRTARRRAAKRAASEATPAKTEA